MAYSEGYPSEGAIQDVADHPDVNLPDPGHGPSMEHSTKMAGEVVPIRPSYLERDIAGARRQVENERTMKNIAKSGSSAVNTNNLTVFSK